MKIIKIILLALLFSQTLFLFSQSKIKYSEIQFECTAITPDEYVINNNEDYYSKIKIHKNIFDCKQYSLPKIDFEKYTLVGFIYLVKGCKEPEFSYNIKEDDNKIIITVNISTYGYCERANRVSSWYLIPKTQGNNIIFNKNIIEQE